MADSIRSNAELQVFIVAQLSVLVLEIMAFFVLSFLTIRELGKRREAANSETKMTLAFIGFSLCMLFIYEASILVPELLITINNDEADQKIRDWENAVSLRLTKAFLWHPAYFLFNMAFIININRWDKLLKEQHYLQRGWGNGS